MYKLVKTSSVLLALAAPTAYAEGPMNTDDAGTLDQGGMKIEAVSKRDGKTRGAELVFGFGPIENVEVGISVAKENNRTNDPSTKNDVNGFVVKWVPIQNDTGWSLGASFGNRGTRVDDRATPERYTSKEFSWAGLATYRLENGQVLHLNMGSKRTKEKGTANDVRNWSIGYEFPLLENLRLTLDAFEAENTKTDSQLGLRYEIQDGLKLYGAVGHGNNRSFSNLGLAWEF